ncbi:MAG TPA: hypothetical protein VNO35_24120 [Steroidobacteraceae bacterium]|nr:hypothetical protein [Steroidobacteraceae bacterium]
MDIMLSMQSTISPAAARESTLVEAIRSRVEPLGGVELQIPPREPMRDPPAYRPRRAALAKQCNRHRGKP